MKYGIENSVWEEICSVFSSYPEIDQVVLFGSRAMGNFRTNSDVDLVIFSNEITFQRLLDLRADLDDLELIYSIDLIDFNRIKNDELKSHIHRVGVAIYDSSESKNKKGLQKSI